MDFVIKGDTEKVSVAQDSDGVELGINDWSESALLSVSEARALAIALNEKADELENKEEK